MSYELRELWEHEAGSSAAGYVPKVKRYLEQQYGAGYAERNPKAAERLAILLSRIVSAAEMANELRSYTQETLCVLQAQLNQTAFWFLTDVLGDSDPVG